MSQDNACTETVIYIDPQGSFTPLLSELAAKTGRELRFCRTAQEGMARLAEAGDCAIVIVVSRPEGHGIEMIRWARDLPHRNTLPIAFVMTQHDLGLAQQALHAGATEIFLASDSAALSAMIFECTSPLPSRGFSGRVLVVEDSAIDAAHITNLSREMGFEVDRCATVDEAIPLLEIRQYELALIDIVLDSMQSGLALVKHIRKQAGPVSALPILVMSGFDDAARRIEALRYGADDYLVKPFADEEFFWRLRRIKPVAKDVPLPPPIEIQDIDAARADWRQRGLSQREIDVCEAVVHGLSDKDISVALKISFWTVRTHVSSIFTKLRVINRRELMTRYLPQHGDTQSKPAVSPARRSPGRRPKTGR